MFRYSIATLVVTLCVASLPASGQVYWSFRDTDAALTGVLSESTFMGGGRLGDLSAGGLPELRLGLDVEAPSATDQFVWTSCEQVPFTLTFYHLQRRVVYTIGGRTLEHETSFQDIDSIFIRGYAPGDSTRVVFSEMSLDGIGVPNHYIRGPLGLRYLQLWGPAVQNGFTLTGLVKLCWASQVPSANDLDFRIIGTKMAIVPVAESTWGGVKGLYR